MVLTKWRILSAHLLRHKIHFGECPRAERLYDNTGFIISFKLSSKHSVRNTLIIPHHELYWAHNLPFDVPGGRGVLSYISYVGAFRPSGSSLLNGVYSFTFLCLEQGRHRKSSSPFNHKIFADFVCPRHFEMHENANFYVPYVLFWIR